MLSFTAEVYFSLLARYNADIWPAQIPAGALALAVLVLAWRGRPASGGIIAAMLGAMWLWTGVIFHWFHFATISFTAPAIAALFAVQGLLLLWRGVARGKPAVASPPGLAGRVGAALATGALVLSPVLAELAGPGWRSAELVGVAPGATALLTVGLFIACDGRAPRYLLVVPLIWSAAAVAAAWFLDSPALMVLPALTACGAMLALASVPERAGRTGAR